ncbi:MAG: alpha-IPM isomerase [Bacillota bacterium]|nr:alpha-IPM isomerase [Bacillota bacterium]
MIKGIARVVGDDVNTDYIISSRRKSDAQDAASLVEFIFEDLPGPCAETSRAVGTSHAADGARRARLINPGGIIVAGRNFGCGSAMEIACEVLRAAEVRAVVALSFARTFFRNAVNMGLTILEADTRGVCDGDLVEILLEPGAGPPAFICRARAMTRDIRSYEGFARELATAGGLLAFLRTHGSIPRGILGD